MGSTVLIGSRNPLEGADAGFVWRIATQLAAAGEDVTLMLVENGVLAARSGARVPQLDAVVEAGVTLRADDFALRERGIGSDRLDGRVHATPLSFVVDRMAAGDRVLWQ